MKIISTLSLFLVLGTALFAQDQTEDTDGGIAFAEYEVQIEASKAELADLEAPFAITDCELEGVEIDFTYEDAMFSGGANGTIERTWIATDACGNEERTVQYIAIKE